jgi:hypothetical protein
MNIILETNKTDMDIPRIPTRLPINPTCILPSDNDFLRIIVPIIDDEENRNSEELEEEEAEELDDESDDEGDEE